MWTHIPMHANLHICTYMYAHTYMHRLAHTQPNKHMKVIFFFLLCNPDRSPNPFAPSNLLVMSLWIPKLKKWVTRPGSFTLTVKNIRHSQTAKFSKENNIIHILVFQLVRWGKRKHSIGHPCENQNQDTSYGDVNENAPHRLVCLNMWSSVGGPVCDWWESMALLEQMPLWRLALRFQKTIAILSFLFISGHISWRLRHELQLFLFAMIFSAIKTPTFWNSKFYQIFPFIS